MQFHIKHATRYRYSRPVFCEPMTIRLRPREDAAQRLLRYNLWIDPQPAGVSDYVDVDGHTATQVWFDQPATALSIVVSSIVETLRTNPFDYLLSPEGLAAPLRYNDTVRLALLPYLQQGDADSEVAAAAARVVKNCGGRLPAFLSELTQCLYADFTRYIRREGPPLEPAETLRRQQGSCRDLTELFNAVCRSVGLAARFVSGYHEQEDLEGRRFLHAWSEVYLPGAGWRGYDPTAGLAVADRHVALAASTSPILAAPTCGTFRGNGADSTMETQLVIRTADRGDPVEQPLHAHFSAADAVVDSGSR